MRSKKAIMNIISSLLLQIITLICGFIIPRLIIEKFGSSVNGLVTSITQFLAYITLLESGFGPVVKSILYKPIANKNKEEIRKILKATEKFFKTISYIFIGYIIILAALLPMIVSEQFDTMFTASLVVIIAISTFSEYFFGMAYKLYLQAEQKTYITSIIQIGTTILNTITVVLLIYFGSTIHIVKIISSLIFVLRPILQYIYIKKKYNIDLKGVESDYKIKQKWDGLAQHIAAVIHNNTDVVILTMFCNTVEVSVYSVYLLIIRGVKSLVQAFSEGIESAFGDMLAKDEYTILNKTFKTYEIIYFTVVTIIFICTLWLIVPFVDVYTQGITDANYHRPIFAILIVLAEFVWTIRLPYSSITLAAGHFKETKNGAWLESAINVVLSIILVWKFQIIGVAIGTLVAMLIRTIEFMYYSSKNILKRSIKYTFGRLVIIALEMSIVMLIAVFMLDNTIASYGEWIVQAIIVLIITTIVVVPINYLVYREETKDLFGMLKKFVCKK